MKVTLTIEVNSLMDAALIDEFVVREKMQANVTMTTTPNGQQSRGKRKARVIISRSLFSQIAAVRNEGLSHDEVAKRFGVSHATVGRIFNGKHVLQKKAAKVAAAKKK